jgi:superfamily II DNA/RNA helicase
VTSLLQSLTIPDPWQHRAAHTLREGKDVVVHAPTGAGKTYIFELLYGTLRGQAVFTVPTRALANDKLAEWQARGWDVGIATGDVAHRLDARIVVATLETQKGRFLERRGPALLVIDEYQMIGDPARGVNYELAIAMAPPQTQLLLLSGSVGNPQDVVDWLRRIGREAVLVSHPDRPVPLEEVDLQRLPDRSTKVHGWWPRMMANALRADLGPILLFSPRRNGAEELAQQLAAALPPDRPLSLSHEQEQLAGPRLSKLLRARVAFHHSGLSYAQRAGIVEPLAKAGELRVVVATMGLAAGINFSMRSVAISGTKYLAGQFERQVQPDELLQMFGRAGRRGLDETGYALITPQPPRLLDAQPKRLRRASQVDWPTLVAVMQAAVVRGENPFAAALALNERLFSLHHIALGVEHSLETGPMPCGLQVDMERARFARRGVVEMLNSAGAWETRPATPVETPLGEAFIRLGERWVPALSVAATLDGVGLGNLCKLPLVEGAKRYGRELVLGTRRDGGLLLAPALKRLLARPFIEAAQVETALLAKLPALTGGGRVVQLPVRGEQLLAQLTYEDRLIPAFVDSLGRALQSPPERRELPRPCRGDGVTPCPQLRWCLEVPIVDSPAWYWRRLGLIERDGVPTRRGILFSFFQHGEGLAVAAALEDESYPIADLVFDLANLRAGPRFSGDDSPYSGHLAIACQRLYGHDDVDGYLAMGVPIDYGAGASEALRGIIELGQPRQKLLTEALRLGDIERAIVEWRSLLRHILHAPDYDCPRWRDLKTTAAQWLKATDTLGPWSRK